jgi:hypothetical protein
VLEDVKTQKSLSLLDRDAEYLTIRKVKGGWTVEKVRFEDGDLIVEKICDPNHRAIAIERFKIAAIRLMRKSK